MRSARGLTVVEVLMAVAIFAGAMVAVIGIFPMSAQAARLSQATVVATELVAREVEITRTAYYQDMVSRSVPPYVINVTHNGVDMTIKYDINVTVVEEVPGVKHIQAQAFWYEPDSDRRTTTLETHVAKLTP